MKILTIFFLLPLKLFAQDITGVWTGFLQTNASNLPYELVISGSKESLDGYSLTIFTFDGIENIGVKSIRIKNKKGTLSIEDKDLIYNNYTTPPKRVTLYGKLLLQVDDSAMILSGTFNTRSIDLRAQSFSPFTGTIRLQKQNTSTETKLIAKLDEMNLLNTLSFFQPKTQKKQVKDMVTVPLEEFKSLRLKEKEKEIFAAHLSSYVIIKQAPTFDEPKLPIDLRDKVFVPLEEFKTLQTKEKEKETFAAHISEHVIVKHAPPIPDPKIIEVAIKSSPTLALKTKPSLEENKKQEVIVSKNLPDKKPSITETKPKESEINPSSTLILKQPSSELTKKENEEVKDSKPASDKKIEQIPKSQEKIVVTEKSSSPLIKTTQLIVTDKVATDIASRKTEIIKSFYFKSDSLVLSLYDNGEIDGDTVSVVMNGQIIIAKQGLTTNAKKLVVHITPDLGDSLQFILYAENLGRIPPNTGLLIIQDGNERNEIRFAGDFQKNSSIVLRRKRE